MKRKRFRRILVPVLIFCLCLICFSVTALADDFSATTLFVDLFDYGLVDPYYDVTPDSQYITITTPERTFIRYIDFVFYGYNYNSVFFDAGPNDIYQLTVVPLGNGVFRAYGQVDGQVESFKIRFSVTQNKRFYIYSMKYTSFNGNKYPTTCTVLYNTNWYYMESHDDPITFTLDDQFVSESVWTNHQFTVYLDEWKPYDFVEFEVVGLLDITSITASSSAGDVPLDFSYYNPNFDSSRVSSTSAVGMAPFIYGYVTVDLRELKRTVDSEVMITITCMTPPSMGGFDVSLYYPFGYSVIESTSTDVYFFEGIKDFFTDLFGGDQAQQEVIDQVQQNQADLNVSVNEQISSSVDSWNVNITTVKGSYDTAYQNTLPALLWLSSFANGIFNGMGWYANIFYMIGFVGIVALILSKSGLGSKIKKM